MGTRNQGTKTPRKCHFIFMHWSSNPSVKSLTSNFLMLTHGIAQFWSLFGLRPLVETHASKDYTITNKAKIIVVNTLCIDNYGQFLLTIIALTLELVLIVIGALFSSARGKGRVAVIGSTSMFDDTWLDKEDNFKLLEFLMSWLTKQNNVQVLILTIYQRCLYFPYCFTCLNL